MKGSRWFALAMVVFLVAMFLVEYNLPKQFVWNPTFSHRDHQPFGCAVFDDVLARSWPNGYHLSDSTFYQFADDTKGEPLAILAIHSYFHLSETDRNAILRLAERGNKIILASTEFSLSDTLDYNMSYSWFRASALKKHAEKIGRRDSLHWLPGSGSAYPEAIFEVYPHLCNTYFMSYDSAFVPLAGRYSGSSLEKVALRCPVGKGEIVLVSTPLLFTNYGMLDRNNAAYIFRLLSSAKDLPVYRTEAYNRDEGEQLSPFRYFLSQPPLRWGLYLTMATLLLFMLFTARRRQRAIPVIRRPENRTLEFAELIGTLYFQRKNHADLVRKKFVYFAEILRREAQIDVEEADDERTLCRRVAGKTGLEEEKIRSLFDALYPVVRKGQSVSEREMKELIDGMDELLNRI